MSIEYYMAAYNFPINSNHLLNGDMETNSYWQSSMSSGASLTYVDSFYFTTGRALKIYIPYGGPPMFRLDVWHAGTSPQIPSGTTPWVTVKFEQGPTNDMVRATIDTKGLPSGLKVNELFLNYDPIKSIIIPMSLSPFFADVSIGQNWLTANSNTGFDIRMRYFLSGQPGGLPSGEITYATFWHLDADKILIPESFVFDNNGGGIYCAAKITDTASGVGWIGDEV